MTELRGFESGELAVSARADDAGVTVAFQGSADSRVMTELGELLTRVHDESVKRSAGEVVVDFRDLEFMNSSCFKAFVTWIVRVQGLAAGTQYRIRFLSDKGKHWQHRSLGALSCFAVDLVQVDA